MSPMTWQQNELDELARGVKKQLRARMRATRRALPAPALSARSARITRHLEALEVFQNARAVGLFWPMPGGEVDLRPLDASLAKRGVARYYPFMDPSETGFTTGFRRIAEQSELELRGRGFLEPPRGAETARAGALDVVLVPALAATPDGHRLGYGKGFYDATLPDVCPPAIAIVVVYKFQLLAEFPVESHDYRCDLVVTDDEVFSVAGPGDPESARVM